jgi:hypothetical protein
MRNGLVRKRFNKKRVLRILSVVLTVTLMISVASLAVVYMTLPSVRDIVSSFASDVIPLRLRTQMRPIAEVPELAETVSGTTSAEPPAPTPQIKNIAPNGMLTYLLKRFSPQSAEIRTCTLLSRPSVTPHSAQEWKSAFDQLASGTITADPVLESMIMPAGFFVRIPAVRQVLETMRDALETGDHRFLDQPTFPPALSQASAQTIRYREALSRISARAYHLTTLARAVQMNPDLANDTRTANLCNLITTAAQNDMGARPSLSVNDEKMALLSYFASVGFSPTQVGFDPNAGVEMSALLTERQVSLSAPWLTSAMGTPLYLVAMRVTLLPTITN